MKAVLTLEFNSQQELVEFVTRGYGDAPIRTISPEDVPDRGAAQPPVAPSPTMLFGQGVTLPAGATPALPDAAAAPSPTAPVAPPASSTVTAPVPPAPAPLPALVVPAAPPATAAPTSPAGAAPTFDTDGLPWDARIHAGSRGTNNDGRWKARQKLNPAEKARVEAELRQALAVNAALAPEIGRAHV